MVDNSFEPPVFFTSLTQAGKSIMVGKALEKVSEIHLTWQSNFFEFEVAALNYRYPKNNRYRYILEGVDQNWYKAGTSHHGRYSALPDGVHTLKVMGSNDDGIWSEKLAQLKVIITPPWWRSWWFRISIGLLAIIIVIGGYQWRIYSIKNEIYN